MKIGAMNDPRRSVYDEVASFGDQGFDFVDLTMEGPRALHVDTDKLRAILDRYGLAVTGHTDPCLPYAYPIQAIREACLKELARCAAVFYALGAKTINIHPCYSSPPAMRHSLVALNIEALKPVVEMAGAYGLTVVLENFTFPFDRVAVFERILSGVPGLYVHLDFGHTNLGKDDYKAFCNQFRGRIRHVHFSDNRSRSDDHMPLGTGNINWKKAVNSLRAIGYDETITLEVFCNNPGMQVNYLDLSRRMVMDLWKRAGESLAGNSL